MKKLTKISLSEVQGKLSRDEMKSIMAGSSSCGMPCGSGCMFGCKCNGWYCE